MAQSTRNPKQQGEEKDNEGVDFYEAENSPTVIGRDQAREMEEHMALQPHENVYDKRGDEPSKPLANKRGLRAREEKAGDGFSYRPSGGTSAGNGGSSSTGGKSMYTPGVSGSKPGSNSSSTSPGKVVFSSLLGSRKKILIGSGTGIIGGGAIAFILLFLPALRLESYLANINQRVFAFAGDAVQHRTEKLFARYMVSGLEQCGAKINAGCRADYSKMGIASNLFTTWQDARIEQKFIDKYGWQIETHKNPGPDQPRFTIKDKDGNQIRLTQADLDKGNFTGGSRALGNEINQGLKDTTRWYEVMQRRSVRKYYARKHGAKFWCFFACNRKDAIDNKTLEAKTKLKYKLIQRTVYPFSAKYGAIFKCLTSSSSSCWEDAQKTGLETGTLTPDEVDELEKLKGEPNQKISQYLLEKMLVKMGVDETSAKISVGAIPIAGQIYLAASLADLFDRMKDKVEDGTLSKMAADVTSAQYMEYYTSMREAGDEVKAGKTSAADVGALMGQFDGAEQSKVYQAYNGSGSSNMTNSSSFASLFSRTAYAATTQSADDYTCADGKPIPTGQLVCSEKTIDKRTFGIESVFKSDNFKPIKAVLDGYDQCYGGGKLPIVGCVGLQPSRDVRHLLGVVNFVASYTVGLVVNGVLNGAKHLPGVGGFIDLMTSQLGRMTNAIFSDIFPLPIQAASPGRERYDGLEAGGELMASEFGKGGYTDSGQPYGLGGKLLTAKQQTAILQDYQQQQDYQYKNSSLIAKFKNLDYSHSLGNQFIASMPTSLSQFGSYVAGIFTRPFAGLHFGALASAQSNILTISPFGVPRYGYPVDDPAFDTDPATLTDQYCQQAQKNWEASKTQDPVTGVDTYSTVNACLLERTVVEDAGSVFTGNDSLDDGLNTSPGTISAQTISGDTKQLAQQILSNPSVSYPLDAVSKNGSTKSVLQALAGGQRAPVTCGDGSTNGVTSTSINPNILKAILDMAAQGKIGVNALSDKCHSSGSNHYRGLAVDFECQGVPFDVTKNDAIAAKYNGKRNSETCSANQHWHYDFVGG